MKRPWYYRMLLSYLPIFFIITSFLFFIFFQGLSSQSKSGAIRATQVMNLMVMDKVENSLDAIDYAIVNFSLNNSILNQFFREDNKNNVVANREILKEIIELKRQNQLIDSIYLVRAHDEIVLTENYMFPLNEFPDYAYVQAVKTTHDSVKWTSLRSYKEFERVPAKNVVTLARSFFTPLGEQCLIIVQVSTNSIRSLVEQTYNPEVSFITIVGDDGHSIFNNVSESSNHVVLASDKSEYLDWTFSSGLVDGAFMNDLTAVSRIWMLLGIIVVILGILSIIYVTGRNYRPMENVVSNLKKLMSEKTDPTMKLTSNEFILIESAIENMIKQSNKMEKQQENEITLRKKHYLYEIIEGVYQITPDEWSAEMTKYHLPVQFSSAQVMVIEIDNFPAFTRNFSGHDQVLLKYAIGNVTNEIFYKYSLTVWSEWISGNRLTCIILPEDVVNLQHIQVAAGEIISWIKQHLPFTITIGIGTAVQQINEVSESYNEAVRVLKYKMLKGQNTVIAASENDYKQSVELFNYIHDIHSMVYDFRNGDASWSVKFKQMITDIRSDELSSNDIISLMNYFIFQLDRTISELAPEYQKVWNELGMTSLTDILESTETLVGIEHLFQEVLNHIGEGIVQAHATNNHHALLQEVREYIQVNFMDPDLSLDRLNAEFNLNAKYLSQLFKDRYGEGFMEFLIKLRMERAQQLLLESSDPIQTISGKVGYANVISFTRAFKKITGQSPGDFRKNNTELP